MKSITSILLVIFINISAFNIYSQLSGSQNGKYTPEEIYSRYSNSIVYVFGYDSEENQYTSGSGVIVSPDGLIYTNFHVISDCYLITVKKGLQLFDTVKIIAIDKDNDAAILKISYSGSDFVPVDISGENKVGETVYTFGNPNGLERTLAQGILSGIRNLNGKNLLQYTASISPGSSGGALINSEGKLIGITCSTYEGNQNLNFAVPVLFYRKILPANVCDTLNINWLNELWSYFTAEDFEYYNKDADSIIKLIYPDEEINETNISEIARIKSCFNLTEDAIKLYNRAIEYFPGNKEMYFNRSKCYMKLDSLVSALSDINYAVLLDSSDENVIMQRADIYFKNRLYDYAIRDYTKVLEIRPENNIVYFNRAECFIEMGEPDLAFNDLTKSIIKDEKNNYAYTYRAQLYEKLKCYSMAAFDYTSALKIYEIPKLYLSRGVNYSRLEMYNYARNDYFMYLSHFPEDPAALNNMAYSFLSSGDNESAIKYFNKALFYDEKHFDSWLGIAICSFREKKIKETIKAFSNAVKIQSKLKKGLKGLNELKESGYFWSRAEEEELLRIFELMGFETKNDPSNFRAAKPKANDNE